MICFDHRYILIPNLPASRDFTLTDDDFPMVDLGLDDVVDVCSIRWAISWNKLSAEDWKILFVQIFVISILKVRPHLASL